MAKLIKFSIKKKKVNLIHNNFLNFEIFKKYFDSCGIYFIINSKKSAYCVNFDKKYTIIEEIILDINDKDKVVKNLILPLLLYFSDITSSVYNKPFKVKSRQSSKIYNEKNY